MKMTLLLGVILFPLFTWSQELKFPELSNWESEGKPRIFNKDNVYEHIDGAAEFYLSYGFETLQVAGWKCQGAELTIEVYDHGDPLHAYGIYSMEKSAKAEVQPIGLEGYGDLSTFNFVAGKYYVKMSGTRLEKLESFSLRLVAKEFAMTLCTKPEYPKIVGLFPGENQLANTCQYIPTEFMGLGFLGSAVRAKYKLNGEEVTVFIIERADREEIERMVNKYISYAEAKIQKPAEGDFHLKDPFNGEVYLRWKGKYLLGATGFSDKKKVVTLLDQVSARLHSGL